MKSSIQEAEAHTTYTGTFVHRFLNESIRVLQDFDISEIQRLIDSLKSVKSSGGRVFVVGVGGSAANAAHFVNDFRKLLDLETYAPSDNVAELTARTNDDGWSSVFSRWLKTSRLCSNDVLLVLSVGGGSLERNISANLVYAMRYARSVNAKILAIIGRSDGEAARLADVSVIVPSVNVDHVTPHCETMQMLLCHLIVNHPDFKSCKAQTRNAVFLDRDGVLVDAIIKEGEPFSARSLEQFSITPSAVSFVRNCREAGLFVACITNQPDVERGLLPRDVLDDMHKQLRDCLDLDDLRVCYSSHLSDFRKKPNPGMLEELAEEHKLNLPGSFMLGDTWKDIEAGRRAGCKTIFLDNGYKDTSLSAAPDFVVKSLAEAFEIIQKSSQGEQG